MRKSIRSNQKKIPMIPRRLVLSTWFGASGYLPGRYDLALNSTIPNAAHPGRPLPASRDVMALHSMSTQESNPVALDLRPGR